MESDYPEQPLPLKRKLDPIAKRHHTDDKRSIDDDSMQSSKMLRYPDFDMLHKYEPVQRHQSQLRNGGQPQRFT